MASLIMKVIKDKSKYRSNIRQTQKQKIDDLKTESVYAYKLKEEFNEKLNEYLDDDDVDYVRIVVPKNYLSVFMKVIYREEFTEYQIKQISDREFEVSRKEIYL